MRVCVHYTLATTVSNPSQKAVNAEKHDRATTVRTITSSFVRCKKRVLQIFLAVGTLQPLVKALVRWATGKRLTNRLPKLSLITLSPPLNSEILGLRMGPHVPTPRFFYNLWGPRESDSSDS